MVDNVMTALKEALSSVNINTTLSSDTNHLFNTFLNNNPYGVLV